VVSYSTPSANNFAISAISPVSKDIMLLDNSSSKLSGSSAPVGSGSY